jgi:hypothetical protein
LIDQATYLLPIAATVGTAGDPSLIHEGAYPFLAEALGYGRWLVYLFVSKNLILFPSLSLLISNINKRNETIVSFVCVCVCVCVRINRLNCKSISN